MLAESTSGLFLRLWNLNGRTFCYRRFFSNRHPIEGDDCCRFDTTQWDGKIILDDSTIGLDHRCAQRRRFLRQLLYHNAWWNSALSAWCSSPESAVILDPSLPKPDFPIFWIDNFAN